MFVGEKERLGLGDFGQLPPVSGISLMMSILAKQNMNPITNGKNTKEDEDDEDSPNLPGGKLLQSFKRFFFQNNYRLKHGSPFWLQLFLDIGRPDLYKQPLSLSKYKRLFDTTCRFCENTQTEDFNKCNHFRELQAKDVARNPEGWLKAILLNPANATVQHVNMHRPLDFCIAPPCARRFPHPTQFLLFPGPPKASLLRVRVS